MVWDYVFCLVEPPGGELSKSVTFVRNVANVSIKGTLSWRLKHHKCIET